MTPHVISATEARTRWFEILNLVSFAGESFIIEKNNVPLVKLTAVAKPNIYSAKEVILKTAGYLKDVKNFWTSENPKIRGLELARWKRIWKKRS